MRNDDAELPKGIRPRVISRGLAAPTEGASELETKLDEGAPRSQITVLRGDIENLAETLGALEKLISMINDNPNKPESPTNASHDPERAREVKRRGFPWTLESCRALDGFAVLVAVMLVTRAFLGAQNSVDPGEPAAPPSAAQVAAEDVPGSPQETTRETPGADVAPGDDSPTQRVADDENIEEQQSTPADADRLGPLAADENQPALTLDDNPPSTTVPAPRDERQATYRLGAGDVMRIRFHGQPEFDRPEVLVAPDGTISYLEANGVKVGGLTIPEARELLEQQLSEAHRSPRLMVSPQVLGSKRFTILGMVKGNGVFPLTRTTRLLEALALSGGIAPPGESGDVPVDFRRSFLVRNGQKLDIDFERLYMQGDLTDNVQVQDGDYIYIASDSRNRCYVLGAVASATSLPVTRRTTVMAAITAAGGYSPEAWKGKVLVVRGRLSEPEVFVVDSADILKGKALDLPVEAGDLIYVHDRPFIRLEKLADVVVNAFIRGAVAGTIDDQARLGY